MKIAYVGFTSETIENVDEFMTLPKAPSNYKDMDKIKAYIEAALVKKKEEAKNSLMTGRLTTATIIIEGEETKTTFLNDDEDFPNPSEVLPALAACDVIAGYRVFDFLDLAVLSRIEAKGSIERKYHWAKVSSFTKRPYLSPSTSHDVPRIVFDPIETLGGADAIENPLVFARRWKLDVKGMAESHQLARLSQLAGRMLFSEK